MRRSRRGDVLRRPFLSLVLALLPLLGTAGAHAYLAATEPAADAVLEAAPAEVKLIFSEAVEVAFSLLKVYRLDTDVDLTAENARLRLNGLAALLVNRELASNEPSDNRVDVAISPERGTSAEIVLTLKGELPPGHYVVMWRVLSVDTHVLQDHYVFSVVP